jgi:hypothetical protein
MPDMDSWSGPGIYFDSASRMAASMRRRASGESFADEADPAFSGNFRIIV